MRDQFGLVPPDIRARHEALDGEVRAAERIKYLDRALKAKDPNLSLVRIKEDINEWDLPLGAIAGYWHIRNDPPGFVPNYIPLTGPKGEFRLPASDVLDIADRSDLRRPEVFRRVIERGERKKAERRKAEALNDEQRRDELVSDLKAGKRVAGEGGLRKRAWGRK